MAVKAFNPAITVVVGGHAASTYPRALADADCIDAIALGEGERPMPSICDAVRDRRPLQTVDGLLIRGERNGFVRTGDDQPLLSLDAVTVPDRDGVARYQRNYSCVNYHPVWTVETARGCQHRCKFCSVWQFHRRTLRFHSIGNVLTDFAAAGPNVFVVDDTFWTGTERSAALADALKAVGAPKNWMLVQSRLDTVVRKPTLLERWRPLARRFDVFFGFESPTSGGLTDLHKDASIETTVAAIAVARKLGFGVTGNFIIDPAYTEDDFRALWAFLEEQKLARVGFTSLTPLPGTRYFDEMSGRVRVGDWDHYDLHHLLWEPRLPVRRFFELYCETWRRSVLYLQGQKRWWHWLRDVQVQDVPRMVRLLRRTQQLMDPEHYVAACAFAPEAHAASGEVTGQPAQHVVGARATDA
jgi:radical SAM superfamily enzyme YgiQ (UPF0313 family)